MRKLATTFFALALLAGCSGKGNTDGGGGTTGTLPGIHLQTDRTALLFGQDYGNATLLGEAPANTLQLINAGDTAVHISAIAIVAGTAPDGGEAQDTSAFTLNAPALPDTIQGGSTDFVQVVFNATAVGRYQAILQITSDDPTNGTLKILLSGDCVTPTIAIVQYTNATGSIVQGSSTDLTATAVQLVPTAAPSTTAARRTPPATATRRSGSRTRARISCTSTRPR